MWAWLPAVLNFVSSLVWPIVALIAVVMFRRPISTFVSEVIEISGLGVSAKRGDLQAARIRNSIETKAIDADIAESAAFIAGHETDGAAASIPVRNMVQFVASVSRFRLNELASETTGVASSDEARLLVVWAYQELVVFVRALQLAEQAGSRLIQVPRYRGPLTFESLARIGGPTYISDALDELQGFKKKIDNRDEVISPDGARTFISTALDILSKIYAWYTGEEIIEVKVDSTRKSDASGPQSSHD